MSAHPWLPERRHVTSTAVSIERYDSWARRRLSRSDVSNHATASCSSGAALTGVPVHLSINQICMSNVAVRISCIGGLDGSHAVIPNSSRSSRTRLSFGSSPSST
jgi:hypothetical protein